MNKIILVVIAVCILLALLAASLTINQAAKGEALVARVIDGDTIELSTGEHVRLLGIDTPERGQYVFRESTEWLREAIENKYVTLERDVTEMDKYDRLLRHVYYGSRHINLELVRLGYARSLTILPDEKFSGEILAAEAEARDKGLGLWKYAGIKDVFCIGIYSFHYNAKGDDNENLNDEYVTFRNSCTYPVELTGWSIKDNSTNTYQFVNFVLQNKSFVTLHTGPGLDNETDVYWGKGRAAWNNNRDALKMWDAESGLILDYAY